jgi:MFS family permease
MTAAERHWEFCFKRRGKKGANIMPAVDVNREIRASSRKPRDEKTNVPRLRAGHWYILAVFTLTSALSYGDRGALPLVIGLVKADLRITDFDASLLLGLSFIIFFSVLTIPAGYLVDRLPRIRLLTAAVLIWSAMEIVCGLAGTYVMLFLGRMGLGIGESPQATVIWAATRDAIPAERRGLAYSILAFGPLLGSGFALWGGGYILQAAASGTFHGLPLIGTLRPWQLVLILPGFLGIPFAILLTTIREPVRTRAGDEGSGYGPVLTHIWKKLDLYGLIMGGFILFGVGAGGMFSWLPEAAARSWALPRAEIGKVLGPVGIAFGLAGILVLGLVIDHLGRRGYRDAAPRVGACATPVAAIAVAAFVIAPTPAAAVALYAIQAFFFGVFNPACIASLVRITPSRLLGRTAAINLLLSQLLGLSLGPIIVVWAEHLFSGPTAIGYGMVVTFVVSIGAAAACLWSVCTRLRSEPVEVN